MFRLFSSWFQAGSCLWLLHQKEALHSMLLRPPPDVTWCDGVVSVASAARSGPICAQPVIQTTCVVRSDCIYKYIYNYIIWPCSMSSQLCKLSPNKHCKSSGSGCAYCTGFNLGKSSCCLARTSMWLSWTTPFGMPVFPAGTVLTFHWQRIWYQKCCLD